MNLKELFNTPTIWQRFTKIEAMLIQLNERIQTLSENNHDNFKILENNLFEKLEQIKAELKLERKVP